MAVRHESGRYAATRYRVLERFGCGMCLVELDLETGRTHQIRVHMASLGSPVAGDVLYGGRLPDSWGIAVPRQLLHASVLSFLHPVSQVPMVFSAPLWPDMELVLDRLRMDMIPKEL
jgi:23S rRNA pseudouridine1911/1915/1917 synthase